MPVPQENLSFVEQASCLFLRMVQDVRYNRYSLGRKESILTPSVVVRRALYTIQALPYLLC
ncbi:hypothetical protein QUA20_03005 [Microcoleus sp. Pol7_A1]|uniref:hypothetical protein n=1 Tax=Microcoleus sp. Pol7_A1 TaxID=2818893 RepID=UPI002FD693A3